MVLKATDIIVPFSSMSREEQLNFVIGVRKRRSTTIMTVNRAKKTKGKDKTPVAKQKTAVSLLEGLSQDDLALLIEKLEARVKVE